MHIYYILNREACKHQAVSFVFVCISVFGTLCVELLIFRFHLVSVQLVC